MHVVIDQIANATDYLNDAEVTVPGPVEQADGAVKFRGARRPLARQNAGIERPIPLEEIVSKVDAVTIASALAAGRALIAAPSRDRGARPR